MTGPEAMSMKARLGSSHDSSNTPCYNIFKTINSRFTCPEKAVLFTGSFQTLFFCWRKEKKGVLAS